MEKFFVWLFHDIFRLVFWVQPCFYALHGWLATEMALWLLFHPYEAKFIPGTQWQLPLTPGILPRGRANLSRSIADAVTLNLLTEQDLHQQVERLITEDNLVRLLEGLLDSIERELQNKEQIRRVYRYGDEVLPALLRQLANGVIDNLEGSPQGKLRQTLAQSLGQVLPQVQVGYHQAEFLTDLLFNTLLTPAALRQMLVDGLTESNILLIERNLSRQVGGLKGFLVRLMGIEQALTDLRAFFETHPEAAEAQLTDILDRLEIRERLAERISAFAFNELPEETRTATLNYMAALLAETLSDHREEITGAITRWSGAGSRLLINRMLQMNLKQWLNESRPDLKRDIARFFHQYLQRELERTLRRILPVLDIGQMIVEKIDQFSNQQLESLIYGICRRELRWLAFLGAFLGFWLGLVSNVINFWVQALKL